MFKNFFNKKKAIVEDKEFTKDFNDALKRYLGVPDGEIEYEFKDNKGNVIPPSYAFEGTYNEWKTIQSVWDKRGVIFSALDEVYFDKNPKHQIIERFVIDRYPHKALSFVQKFATEEDFNNSDFLASLAKCYFFCTDLDKSISLAKKALEIDVNNKKAKIALADSLHLSGSHQEAHEIYDEILKNSKIKDWKSESINIYGIVDFNSDILPSSVYAVALLSDDEVNEETWTKISEEFYHCPYFRSQHAFWLLRNEESMKGMAKLISASQEFPWFKDIVVNAKNGIDQFREQMGKQDLWEEEHHRLSKIMEEEKW